MEPTPVTHSIESDTIFHQTAEEPVKYLTESIKMGDETTGESSPETSLSSQETITGTSADGSSLSDQEFLGWEDDARSSGDSDVEVLEGETVPGPFPFKSTAMKSKYTAPIGVTVPDRVSGGHVGGAKMATTHGVSAVPKADQTQKATTFLDERFEELKSLIVFLQEVLSRR
jgi:hypothetical protein